MGGVRGVYDVTCRRLGRHRPMRILRACTATATAPATAATDTCEERGDSGGSAQHGGVLGRVNRCHTAAAHTCMTLRRMNGGFGCTQPHDCRRSPAHRTTFSNLTGAAKQHGGLRRGVFEGFLALFSVYRWHHCTFLIEWHPMMSFMSTFTAD